MSYTSPVAWVDSGHRMSEWVEADRTQPDMDFLRQAAARPTIYPVERPLNRTDEGYETVSLKELVGKFIVY